MVESIMPKNFNSKVFDDVRLKFILVGALNYIAGVSIFAMNFLIFKESINYILIFTISQFIAVLFSHFTQRTLVWKSFNSYWGELLRFAGAYVGIYISNLLLLFVAVSYFEFPVLASQLCASLFLVFASFVFQKKWIFA
jgi:putative flippase GtrA